MQILNFIYRCFIKYYCDLHPLLWDLVGHGALCRQSH